MALNISKLKGVLPEDIFSELTLILSTRQVTKNQLCHLLANAEHECQNWTRYSENLNYTPKRAMVIFKKYFKDLNDATQVIKSGVVKFADRVYGGRMGNVKGTSDAYNFRGGGTMMLTGKKNYELFDATVPESIVDNPELVRTKYKLRTAFWFFDTNKLWALALRNDPATKTKRSSVAIVRIKVNGGLIGIDDVNKKFQKFQGLIS